MKTRDEIIKECVYAVACCVDHYCDEGLSEEGFEAVRKALDEALPGSMESGIAYRESVIPQYPEYPEFRDRIIWPTDWWVTEDYNQ